MIIVMMMIIDMMIMVYMMMMMMMVNISRLILIDHRITIISNYLIDFNSIDHIAVFAR